MFHTYNLHMLMQSYTFLSYHISFQVIYTFLLILVNMYLSLFSYHHIAMLCFSYHVIYHIHFICLYLSFSFMFHACKNLRSGYGKELYILEDTITVRDSDLYLYVPEGTITVRDNDLYLYDPNGAVIMIQTGSMPSTQTGPQYL